jgi:four helix bundle protein
MLPHERLEVYWLAQEYVAFVDYLMPSFKRAPRNDVNQLDRAAGSIPYNIGEGCSDRTPKERIRFFCYARRSTSECHAIFTRLHRRGCVSDLHLRISYSYADRISAMLYNLIKVQ